MSGIVLEAAALTREAFAPYGDVIETASGDAAAMNDARFDRFNGLCDVDTDGGRVSVGIVRSRTATPLPYRFDVVERHPHGSQAFIPLAPCRFVVVVAPPGERVEASALRAFLTNGEQGINYRRGTWHMPLIAFEAGQAFLVIDRAGDGPNCDEQRLDAPVTLLG